MATLQIERTDTTYPESLLATLYETSRFNLVGVLRPNTKKTWCMGPHAGVHYNLTRVSTPTHLLGKPYPRVDLNAMPESTLSGTLDLASDVSFPVNSPTTFAWDR